MMLGKVFNGVSTKIYLSLVFASDISIRIYGSTISAPLVIVIM